MTHINWWAVAFGVSVVAKNFVTYMPVPGSAPGFISNPWYLPIYHGMQGLLALNVTSSVKMLSNGKGTGESTGAGK